jgi:3-isopropylmalate/(R)-2-methylmalate dehydratase small subunit
MEPFRRLESHIVPILRANCDTDQIIPARFLQKLRANDFGRYLFADERFDGRGGRRPEHILNRAPYDTARIMLGGRNFGCGSSREHAVWALSDFGIRAVIAPGFGDIFAANALKNVLLPVTLPEAVTMPLAAQVAEHPDLRIVIDLPEQTVLLPDGTCHVFEIDPFAKNRLVKGIDELDYTLSLADLINRFEKHHEQP